MERADSIIRKLEMKPVPGEGGCFVRVYTAGKAGETVSGRNAATSILYLLRGGDCSRWHKLLVDEIWMYHAGSAARQLLLFPDGSWSERRIGPDLFAGEVPQSVIPAGTWQSTVLEDRAEQSWGLFGTVCIPGFEYEHYTGGSGAELMKQYPSAAEQIAALGSN